MGEFIIETSLIQGILALVSVGAMIYLVVTGQQVPDELAAVVYTVIGFYFGSVVRRGPNGRATD